MDSSSTGEADAKPPASAAAAATAEPNTSTSRAAISGPRHQQQPPSEAVAVVADDDDGVPDFRPSTEVVGGRYMLIRNVFLHRDPERKSFGLQIKSPGEKERTNSIGCLVRAVLPSCSAPEGTILPEDQLLSINEKITLDWSYHEVLSYIKGLKLDTLVMSFRRELPKPAKATKATGASDAAPAVASSAGGGATGASGAAVATGTSDVPDGDPPPGQAGSTAAADAAATSSSAGGGATVAAGAAVATSTSDVPCVDPQLGQAGSTATADANASSSSADGASRTPRKSRTPSQGTVSYQEEFQAPNHSPNRVGHEDRWNNHIGALKKYKKENGHCNVPRKYPSNQSLSEFVQYVRAAWQDLSEDRLEMLKELDFAVNAHEDRWDVKFHAVKDFFREAGYSGRSMSALRSEKPALYKWIRKQREAYAKWMWGKKSSMTEDKVSALEGIGVDLDPSGKFAEGDGGGGSSRKEKKTRGATSSGSSSSARSKSQNFHRRRQMVNQQGGVPAARKRQKQVARKRTGRGIEIGSFEEPQQKMSYASDQPSQYHSSQAQGATARKQDHAATASPTVAINQSGPGVSKEAAYAGTDAHQESSFGDVGIDLHPTDSPMKSPYDGSGDDNKHRRSKMDITMSDSSYQFPPADGEDRNYRTHGGPFSRQATSRRAAGDANTRPGNRKQPQQKEASTLKAPYLGDQSYRHHASAGPVASQKAMAGAGIASEHASYCDAAKASTSHDRVSIAQHQGRSAASLSSAAAKIDTRGSAIDSSQGQRRHSMKAMPKDAGWGSGDERRQHVQEVVARGGFNPVSGVSTIHQRQLLRSMIDYDDQVATAAMAGASDPIDYRPAFLRADLDLTSIEDPRGQVQTQRARPTRKKTTRADKKAKPSTTANKKAKPSRGSGTHQGFRDAVANQRKTVDPVLVSADHTSTSHTDGVPQNRRATNKGVWKVNREQTRVVTDHHNDPRGLALCGFARVSTTATRSTRAAEASSATERQMDVGIITHRRGQGQQSQQKKVRLSEKESSHSSGAVNGHHNYAYPSDQGHHEQGGRAVSEEAIDDGRHPSFQEQSPNTNRKDAKANADNLACTIDASPGQGQGQHRSLKHEETAAKKASHSNSVVANHQSYNPVNQLDTVPVSVAVSPTGAPKADYNGKRRSEITDAPAIGNPQQQDQESQGREQEQPQNDIFSDILETCWDNSPDGMCSIEPVRSELNQKARSLSEAVGVEEAVRKGKALGLVTEESCQRLRVLCNFRKIELTNPSGLEPYVRWDPDRVELTYDPVYTRRLNNILKAKGFDVGDLPRSQKVLEEELEEGRRLQARCDFLYENPEELEKTIKRAPHTNADIGIAPVIREMFRYVESIAGTETFDVFCNATGEKQLEMIAEYTRKNPFNPAGLVSLDYTGPPGKRTFAEDPKKKKAMEAAFVCPLIKKRMELMIEGCDRQRKRLISLNLFEAFEKNRVRILALEKERQKDLSLEERELYVRNAREVREAMWNLDVDPQGNKLTYEQQLDKAAYIFWWFYHHDCLLEQCVSQEHWVPNKDEVWIRPDILQKAARVDEYFFGEERRGFKVWKAWEENFPFGRDLQPRQDFVSKARREYLKWLENIEKDWFKLFNHLAEAGNAANFEEATAYWETLSNTWVEEGKQVFVDLLHYHHQQEQQESQDGRSP